MSFRVEYTAKALKQLQKMDRFDAALITSWISKNFEGIDDPRRIGKSLTGDHSGEWRYRVGDYRILCFIRDNVLTIEVFEIGHRKHVCKH